MSKVEILTTADYKKAAKTLYEAFSGDTDDVANYVSYHLKGQPELKKKVEMSLYECYVYSHMLKGLVIGVKGENHEFEDSFESVAVWSTPQGGDFTDPLTMLRSGWIKFSWLTGSEGRRRVFKTMFQTLHENQVEILADEIENCYTLVYLGSTPKARGKGNVRKMFDFMFENYIDKNNSISYLESSAIINIPIYTKFGFQPVKDIWLGDKNDPNRDCARMDVMVRGARGKQWNKLNQIRTSCNYQIPDF
ncbi:hypothetical protein PACTADRAFT_49630 [Pachysolen tannophilus NRRL Y-2460]|uniref:N-acetyltransferase domain-containing protein n=1 Tax=Pachysolen tannophilus NRRL Y-2460 TaxID=669874 RepID=A0A1E4TX64_PACTA|nr:hypothetical protein PACTADRAFT_49630 [Pachysolen tannophilus NRRL Y-2460]